MTAALYPQQRGFTLIETLVALLIVAVAYAGVATAISQFVDQRLMLVERHSSHRVAWNRLMEQYVISERMAIDVVNFGEQQGSVMLRGNQWHWQISEEKAAGNQLVRYQVDVVSGGQNQGPSQNQESSNITGSLSAYFVR